MRGVNYESTTSTSSTTYVVRVVYAFDDRTPTLAELGIAPSQPRPRRPYVEPPFLAMPPRERFRARYAWWDAPRLPCYRAVRRR